MLHAAFGAQPLLVLRPTGPITAITGKLYDASLQVCLSSRRWTTYCMHPFLHARASLALSARNVDGIWG